MTDLTELRRETRSSIEVTRNSKGEYQWVIKRYHEDTPDETAQALKDISSVDRSLRTEYLPS